MQYDKGYNHSYDEWEAYHKEINAELLEACKELCEAMKLTKPGDVLPEQFAAHNIATQAIAKAEGRK